MHSQADPYHPTRPNATPVVSTTATVSRLRESRNTSARQSTRTASASRAQPCVAAHTSAHPTTAGAGYPHHMVQSVPGVLCDQKFVAPDRSPRTVTPRSRNPAVSAATTCPSSCTMVTG